MDTILRDITSAPPVPAYIPKTPAAQQQWIADEVIKAQKQAGSGKSKVSLLDILSGAGNVLTSILGAKSNNQVNGSYIQLQQPEKKDNTILIVVAVVVVVIIVAIILLKKKAVK